MRVERALETVKKRVVREKLAIRVAQVFGVKHVEAMDEDAFFTGRIKIQWRSYTFSFDFNYSG